MNTSEIIFTKILPFLPRAIIYCKFVFCKEVNITAILKGTYLCENNLENRYLPQFDSSEPSRQSDFLLQRTVILLHMLSHLNIPLLHNPYWFELLCFLFKFCTIFQILYVLADILDYFRRCYHRNRFYHRRKMNPGCILRFYIEK